MPVRKVSDTLGPVMPGLELEEEPMPEVPMQPVSGAQQFRVPPVATYQLVLPQPDEAVHSTLTEDLEVKVVADGDEAPSFWIPNGTPLRFAIEACLQADAFATFWIFRVRLTNGRTCWVKATGHAGCPWEVVTDESLVPAGP